MKSGENDKYNETFDYDLGYEPIEEVYIIYIIEIWSRFSGLHILLVTILSETFFYRTFFRVFRPKVSVIV